MLKDVHVQDAAHLKREGGRLSLGQWQRLLERIDEMWVQGVLEPSMKNRERLVLMWQRWSRDQQGESAEMSVRSQETLLEAFDTAGGRLLISGAFGSGKTTAMLELLSALLRRAEQDAALPIPIVCNLTSWSIQSLPLEKWLALEVAEMYQYHIGRFKPEHFVLLLDGLDDVPTEKSVACLQAINTFLQDHEQVSVVVCCNNTQQMYVNEIILTQMVVLQPLTVAQIDIYFSPLPALQGAVRAALEADLGLYEVVSQPLNLDMLMRIYQRRAPESMTASDLVNTINALCPAFVQSASEVPVQGDGYEPEAYVRGLNWLNQQLWMSQRNEFRLEQMQPYLLVVGRKLWLYRCMISIPAICVTLVGFFVFNGYWREEIYIVSFIIYQCAVILYPVFRLTVTERREANFRNVYWLPIGFISASALQDWLNPLYFGSLSWIWLAVTVIVLLACANLNGLYDRSHVSLQTHQWLWRARRRAVVAGLLSVMLFCIYEFFAQDLSGFADGLRLGLFFGIMSSLGQGGDAYIEHYVLRFCLWRARFLPWDLVTWLDNAVGSGLLYRVGSGYIFRNRLLQRYFDDKRS